MRTCDNDLAELEVRFRSCESEIPIATVRFQPLILDARSALPLRDLYMHRVEIKKEKDIITIPCGRNDNEIFPVHYVASIINVNVSERAVALIAARAR